MINTRHHHQRASASLTGNSTSKEVLDEQHPACPSPTSKHEKPYMSLQRIQERRGSKNTIMGNGKAISIFDFTHGVLPQVNAKVADLPDDSIPPHFVLQPSDTDQMMGRGVRVRGSYTSFNPRFIDLLLHDEYAKTGGIFMFIKTKNSTYYIQRFKKSGADRVNFKNLLELDKTQIESAGEIILSPQGQLLAWCNRSMAWGDMMTPQAKTSLLYCDYLLPKKSQIAEKHWQAQLNLADIAQFFNPDGTWQATASIDGLQALLFPTSEHCFFSCFKSS